MDSSVGCISFLEGRITIKNSCKSAFRVHFTDGLGIERSSILIMAKTNRCVTSFYKRIKIDGSILEVGPSIALKRSMDCVQMIEKLGRSSTNKDKLSIRLDGSKLILHNFGARNYRLHLHDIDKRRFSVRLNSGVRRVVDSRMKSPMINGVTILSEAIEISSSDPSVEDLGSAIKRYDNPTSSESIKKELSSMLLKSSNCGFEFVFQLKDRSTGKVIYGNVG